MHILLLFDVLIVYIRIWEVNLSQFDNMGGIVVMIGCFHLDFVVVCGNGELSIWWWDSCIHLSNGLIQMRLMTDIVKAMIIVRCCGDIVRGFQEFFLYGEVVFPSRYLD